MAELPAYHGRTHLPGGTDPIPLTASDPSWAIVYGSASVAHSSFNYYIPLSELRTNDTATFGAYNLSAGVFDYLQINTLGRYRVEFLITPPATFDNTHDMRVQTSSLSTSLYSDGATFPGVQFTKINQMLIGNDAAAALYHSFVFHWNPAAPVDPLKIRPSLVTDSSTATLTLTTRMYVERIAGPSYTQVLP